MGILRAIHKKVLPKYVFEILNSRDGRNMIRQECDGSNIKNLGNSIGEVKIPIPPLDVQRKIVAECAEVDTECARMKKVVVDAESRNRLIIKSLMGKATDKCLSGDLQDFMVEVVGGNVIAPAMNYCESAA